MKKLKTTLRHGLIGLCAVVGMAGVGHACGSYDFGLVNKAIGDDLVEAKAAQDELKAMGERGVMVSSIVFHSDLQDINRDTVFGIGSLLGAVSVLPDDQIKKVEKWSKIKELFVTLTNQHDGHMSRLYWHTDLNKAKEVSVQTKRPVLSLRLLGNLSDQFSCANSRFFRSVLYSNTELGNYLRSNYVLHWESVRPVPKVTIDFGDGRVVRQTVTGNSIHYVLDSKGRILDAIPGLYDAKTFGKILKENHKQFASLNGLDDKPFAKSQHTFISLKYNNLATAFTDVNKDKDFAALKVADFTPELLEEFVPEGYVDGVLDQASTRIIRAQFPPARQVAQRAVGKSIVEIPFFRAVNTFKRNVVHDTIRNQYAMRAPLLTWLKANPTVNLDEFNDRVYREMFHTPAEDPWLGLYTDGVYTGLDNGGITLAPQPKASLTP